MKIEKLVVGQLQTNCYLVWEEKSRETVIIDPADDADYIIRKIQDFQLKPKLILATHGHFDHVLAIPELKLAFGIPFWMHQADLFLLKRSRETAKYFTGAEADPPLLHRLQGDISRRSSRRKSGVAQPRKKPLLALAMKEASLPNKFIKEGDLIKFGKEKLQVLETPGHSPGEVSFYKRGVVFDGDTLFYRGIGRTDFSYASGDDLIGSIKNKLFKLPDETIVYPGHGEETTIGEEKKNISFKGSLFF